MNQSDPSPSLCETSDSSQAPTLTSLPQEDIIHRHVFPFLHLRDLFCLAATCRDLHTTVHDYFQVMAHLDLIYVGPKFNRDTFVLIVKNSFMLRRVRLGPAQNWIQIEDIVPIIKNNENLESVDLTGCTSLNNGVLHSLGRWLPQLREVRLSGCQWVSNIGLIMMVENCRRLTVLDLSSCWELENDTLISMTKLCKKLLHVSVSGIYSVRDSLLMALAHNCPDLVVLKIQGCWRVTDDGITCVSEYCKNLRMLLVRDCRSVTEASLARLRPRGVIVDRPQTHYRLEQQHEMFLGKVKLQV